MSSLLVPHHLTQTLEGRPLISKARSSVTYLMPGVVAFYQNLARGQPRSQTPHLEHKREFVSQRL